MIFTVFTLFPEITGAYFANSIMARALERGIIRYRAVNIRDFALDRHKTCDDAPYGGGPGMLMLAEPLSRALESAGIRPKVTDTRGVAGQLLDSAALGCAAERPGGGGPDAESTISGFMSGNRPPHVIYLSPSGRPFTQRRARELAELDALALICGRYEGIDQRIIDAYVDEELSVGDYVLSSGEAAALVVIDAVYRLVEGVINAESLEEESFSGGNGMLLEYPQYTRPEIFDTMKVPEVLLSGHHEKIRKWRLEKRVEKTLGVRPELIEQGLQDGLFDPETVKLIEHTRQEG